MKPITMPCQGRDEKQNKVLEEAVLINFSVAHRPDGSEVSLMVDCEYNGGGHGQKCLAAPGNHGICPYSQDLPHFVDSVYKS